MNCKVFKISLQDESGVSQLNGFLESVELKQVFASIVYEKDEHFWSILAFYEDEKSSPKSIARESLSQELSEGSAFRNSAQTRLSKDVEKLPPKAPPTLTPEQESDFDNLKRWRNERAAQDGLAPYMIAHNDSLRQIAASTVLSKEDLLQIKGFGEKRTEKYGDEILGVLNNQESDV